MTQTTEQAIVKIDADALSSSEQQVAAIAEMTAETLHGAILQTYVDLGESALMYQALVLDARRRMASGEKVGGYTTWKEYADLYLRRADESLPTCLRRLRRALEGVNPDKKHRNKKKTNRQILAEADADKDRLTKQSEEKAYKRGFNDGTKSLKLLAAKVAADKKTIEKLNASNYRGMLLSLVAEVEAGGTAETGWSSVIRLAAKMRTKL